MKRKVVAMFLSAVAIGCAATGCAKGNAKEDATAAIETASLSTETAENTALETAIGTQEATNVDETVDPSEENSEKDTGKEVTSEAETEDGEALEYPDYTALDYVELGDYSFIEVPIPEVADVTDEEVSERIHEKVMDGYAKKETEGEIKDGDIANITYTGSVDGEEKESLSAEDYDLEIGSGQYVGDFEEKLIGAKIGDETIFSMEMPEGSGDYEGQTAEFHVTVNYVQREPELTDNLVSEMTDGEITDVDKYKETIHNIIRSEHEDEQEEEQESEFLEAVKSLGTVTSIPDELMEYYKETILRTYENYATMAGMDMATFAEQYMGMTEEELEEDIEGNAASDLPLEMVLQAIAEKEGLAITDEEYSDGLDAYATTYGYDTADDMMEDYSGSQMRHMILNDKALRFLMERSNIADAAEE